MKTKAQYKIFRLGIKEDLDTDPKSERVPPATTHVDDADWRHVSICSSFYSLFNLSTFQVNELRSEHIAAASLDKVLEQFMRTNRRTLVDKHEENLKIFALLLSS